MQADLIKRFFGTSKTAPINALRGIPCERCRECCAVHHTKSGPKRGKLCDFCFFDRPKPGPEMVLHVTPDPSAWDWSTTPPPPSPVKIVATKRTNLEHPAIDRCDQPHGHDRNRVQWGGQ